MGASALASRADRNAHSTPSRTSPRLRAPGSPPCAPKPLPPPSLARRYAPGSLALATGASPADAVPRRLTTGDRVRLAPGRSDEGCLRVGEVGTITTDDHSSRPYQVTGPRGDTHWFNAGDLVASEASGSAPAPAAPARRLTVGDSVRLAPGGPTDGCLRPGETGSIFTDDGSAQPWNVRGPRCVQACVRASLCASP